MARNPFGFFTTVRESARAIPNVEESTGRGAPSLKLRGKLLTCFAIHKSAEPNSLMVRIGSDQRAELIAAAPDVYYITVITWTTERPWTLDVNRPAWTSLHTVLSATHCFCDKSHGSA